MVKVYVKKGWDRGEKEENFEAALRTFKRKVNRDGVLSECKKREFYVKPGVAKREKRKANERARLKKMRKYNKD